MVTLKSGYGRFKNKLIKSIYRCLSLNTYEFKALNPFYTKGYSLCFARLYGLGSSLLSTSARLNGLPCPSNSSSACLNGLGSAYLNGLSHSSSSALLASVESLTPFFVQLSLVVYWSIWILLFEPIHLKIVHHLVRP